MIHVCSGKANSKLERLKVVVAVFSIKSSYLRRGVWTSIAQPDIAQFELRVFDFEFIRRLQGRAIHLNAMHGTFSIYGAHRFVVPSVGAGM